MHEQNIEHATCNGAIAKSRDSNTTLTEQDGLVPPHPLSAIFACALQGAACYTKLHTENLLLPQSCSLEMLREFSTRTTYLCLRRQGKLLGSSTSIAVLCIVHAGVVSAEKGVRQELCW